MANPAETDTTKTETILLGWNGTSFRHYVMDSSTRAFTTIDHGHHEIHAGNSYSRINTVEIPINNVYDVQVITPNTAKLCHLFFNFDVESETNWYLYRGVTVTTTGTLLTSFNADHNSTNVAGLKLYGIANGSVADANADTHTTASTLVYSGIIGAKGSCGSYDHQHEIILKKNTIYSFRFLANAAGYVNKHFDWYEHTNNGETGDMW